MKSTSLRIPKDTALRALSDAQFHTTQELLKLNSLLDKYNQELEQFHVEVGKWASNRVPVEARHWEGQDTGTVTYKTDDSFPKRPKDAYNNLFAKVKHAELKLSDITKTIKLIDMSDNTHVNSSLANQFIDLI